MICKITEIIILPKEENYQKPILIVSKNSINFFCFFCALCHQWNLLKSFNLYSSLSLRLLLGWVFFLINFVNGIGIGIEGWNLDNIIYIEIDIIIGLLKSIICLKILLRYISLCSQKIKDALHLEVIKWIRNVRFFFFTLFAFEYEVGYTRSETQGRFIYLYLHFPVTCLW